MAAQQRPAGHDPLHVHRTPFGVSHLPKPARQSGNEGLGLMPFAKPPEPADTIDRPRSSARAVRRKEHDYIAPPVFDAHSPRPFSP